MLRTLALILFMRFLNNSIHSSTFDSHRASDDSCVHTGIQPYPFGPVNGSHHDSFVLAASDILNVMRRTCAALGHDYVLFGDSAYPVHRHLWRMYKGVMSPAMQQFNADMSPERVSVEWGSGKIVALWPFLDYRKKMKVLLSPVGTYLQVGNILTNMHTCLRGSIISRRYEVPPPSLAAYMAGGPY